MTFRTLDANGHFSGELEIINPTRTRKWGFGYCTTPDRSGPYGIELPSRPEYVGTIRQVREEIANDRTLRSFTSGGTYHTQLWFYDGVPVSSEDVREWLFDMDYASDCPAQY